MQQIKTRDDVVTQDSVIDSEPPQNDKKFWLAMLGIVLVAAIMYTTFAVCWVKFSRAEVFFAECAREMIVQNNMVTPLYHGQPFFDKPILMYWFIVSMFKTFGVSHFAARVPSIICALGTIALTGWMTKKVAPASAANTAGLLASMMLASSFMFFSFAYLCMSDMTLVLMDVATLVLLYAGVIGERKRTWLWWLASVSMGLAFITKGPVGIVLPALAFVAYLAITRQLKIIKVSHVVLGGITAALIALPWFYAAYQANGTWALAYFFIRENLIRYAGTMYDTHKPVWFMVQSLALGFLPWTLLIPFAFRNQFAGMKAKIAQRANDPVLFMWIWTAVLIGFFSFSRGKCDYYALPVYPAVAALAALYISEKPDAKLQRVATAIVATLFVAVGGLSPIILSVFSAQAGFASWWMLPTVLVISGGAALVACANKKQTMAFASLFVGLCLGAAGFAAQLFPTVMASQSIDEYARAIAQTRPGTAIGVHFALHHWVDELTFQSQREPKELANSAAIATLFASGPALVLIPEDDYRKALSEETALRNADLRILDQRRVSSHPLTPGYVIKRKGNILDRSLVLVSN